MNVSGIYLIKSTINPKRIYIGSAVNIHKRWNYHREDLRKNKHGNQRLQNHYNKYGEYDLQFFILLGCEKEELIRYEQFFIDSYNPYFNICKVAGSRAGMIHSKETKAKMRESAKKKPPVSDRTRQKQRETAIRNGSKPPVLFGNKNMTGKHHSEETKLRMSMKRKGKKLSPEHIRKMTIGRNKRGGYSEESKLKISISTKARWARLKSA